jgi:hypothetical protein
MTTLAALRFRLLLAPAVCAALAGCGDIEQATRPLPSERNLTFRSEVDELPWQPPALDEAHRPRPQDRDENAYLPGRGYPRGQVGVDRPAGFPRD